MEPNLALVIGVALTALHFILLFVIASTARCRYSMTAKRFAPKCTMSLRPVKLPDSSNSSG